MTVETQSNIVIYGGDNVAVNFPFTFPVYDKSHLQVYSQDLVTLEQILVGASNYTVTGIGDPLGGQVTFTVPPSNSTNIIIVRIVPYVQSADILNQGGFYPAVVENEFDLQEMQIQQLAEQLTRTIRSPLGENLDLLPPAPSRAGMLLGFTNDDEANPTTDTRTLLFNLLASMLSSGPGISITAAGGEITITSLIVQEPCWLLEDGTPGGGASTDAEAIRDVIGTALQGTGCVITVNDPGDTITVDLTQNATAEVIRDVVGVALTAGALTTVTVNDPGDTITIAVDTAAVDERARDAVGAALVGGVGVSVTVDDTGNTITVDEKPDVLAVMSNATVTPTFAHNQVNITAQAVNLTLANWTGTPFEGHGILIRIKDNGTTRTITYDTKYRAIEPLPTSTTPNKTMYLGFIYNATDDKFDLVGVKVQP